MTLNDKLGALQKERVLRDMLSRCELFELAIQRFWQSDIYRHTRMVPTDDPGR